MTTVVWCHKNFKLMGIIQLKIYQSSAEVPTLYFTDTRHTLMTTVVWCHKNFKLMGIIQLKIYHDYIKMSTEKAQRPTEDIISRSSIEILTWSLLHLQT